MFLLVLRNFLLFLSMILVVFSVQAKKYVLTGGPCNGKTTIIKELEKRGFNTIPEGPTQLILEALEKKLPNPVRPDNMRQFQFDVVKRQVFLERAVTDDKPYFLDRAIIDVFAYCQLCNIQDITESLVPPELDKRYDLIFIIDCLDRDIENNAVRLEDKKTAQKIHELIIKNYTEHGYNPIIVPAFQVDEQGKKLSVEDSVKRRTDFILERIEKKE